MPTVVLLVSCCCQDFEPVPQGQAQPQHRSALCKFNFHHFNCQLTEQVIYRRLTAGFREDWLEREMGRAKVTTRDKVNSNAAHVAVGKSVTCVA